MSGMGSLMMDPEMIRLAQEQMSRMSPDDLARMQQMMMSNPELVKMAAEGLKDMRPEDVRRASEQLRHTRSEDMAEVAEKMANASPEEIAAMRTRANAEMTYTLNAAEMLKKQGNNLHGQGKFRDASQKYMLAKNKLRDLLPSQTRTLSLACSVNLMSCYLKMGQYEDCIEEGSEVLAYDEKNVKALYRRGQAYQETGDLKAAVSDLARAHELSPDDETIAEVLRNMKEKYGQGGFKHVSKGLVIEEIVDDEANSVSASVKAVERLENTVKDSKNDSKDDESCWNANVEYSVNRRKNAREAEISSEKLSSPEITSKIPVEQLQKTAGNVNSSKDKGPHLTSNLFNNQRPEMAKSFSETVSKMAPDELQKMLEMASSSMGEMGNNQMPKMSPDMIKTALEMFSKMPSEELENMFEIAASLNNSGPNQTVSASDNQARTDTDIGESRPGNSFSSMGTHSASAFQQFPTQSSDLQEQMRNAMKDPAMNQMLSGFLKNMSPEMMMSMSQSLGMNMTPEDAAKAHKAMSSVSADELDRLMKWVGHIQRAVDGARKTKNWLLGKPGMIFAVCMLILAFVLHKLGFIGS